MPPQGMLYSLSWVNGTITTYSQVPPMYQKMFLGRVCEQWLWSNDCPGPRVDTFSYSGRGL